MTCIILYEQEIIDQGIKSLPGTFLGGRSRGWWWFYWLFKPSFYWLFFKVKHMCSFFKCTNQYTINCDPSNCWEPSLNSSKWQIPRAFRVHKDNRYKSYPLPYDPYDPVVAVVEFLQSCQPHHHPICDFLNLIWISWTTTSGHHWKGDQPASLQYQKLIQGSYHGYIGHLEQKPPALNVKSIWRPYEDPPQGWGPVLWNNFLMFFILIFFLLNIFVFHYVITCSQLSGAPCIPILILDWSIILIYTLY